MENNLDLIEELNRAGEPIKNEFDVNPKDVEEVMNAQPPEFDDDDDDDTIDATYEEVGKEGHQEPKAAPSTPEQKASYKRSAERYVKAFNSLLKVGLPGWYRSKIMKKGDFEKINEYRKKKELDPRFNLEDAITSDDHLYKAFKRYEKLEEYINDAPLTADEQKDLVEPLSEVIEKYKFLQMGPEGQLLLSVGLIMLPRLEPMFPNLSGFVERVLKDR